MSFFSSSPYARSLRMKWLLLPLLLLLAMGLGLACSGGGGGDKTLGLLERYLRASRESESELDLRAGEMAEGFPSTPSYPGSRVVVSSTAYGREGTRFFALMNTDDEQKKVLDFFRQEFDRAPWQVTAMLEERGSRFLRFQKGDSPGTEGILRLSRPPQGSRGTDIHLSLSTSDVRKREFAPGASLTVPSDFPQNIPIYPDSTTTSILWLQGQGGQGVNRGLRLVTTAAQSDIISFYEDQLPKNGWQITEQFADTEGFNIAFGSRGGTNLGGFLTMRPLPEDERYTEVVIQIAPIRSGPAP